MKQLDSNRRREPRPRAAPPIWRGSAWPLAMTLVVCMGSAAAQDGPVMDGAAVAVQAEHRLADAEARIRELEAQLAERDARIAALEAAAAEQAALAQRLDDLRARMPAPEGGTVTAEEARQRASRDAATLLKLVENARGVDNPRLWAEVRNAENALHRSQYLLTRTDNARTVYRVRPGDDLAQISLMFYSTTERWTEIYDANRHVIDDPGRVLPGITLVVP